MNLSQLATLARESLVTQTRANGDTFISINRDDAPDWLSDLCHAAHGDMMPDDYKYQFIADALDIIAEGSDDDSGDVSEAIDSDVDVYTHDLLTWLASNINRVSYVDEALKEGANDLNQALMQGQYNERREVFDSVFSSLENLVTEDDEEATA